MPRKRNEKNNFQDKAEEREYSKGFKAGKSSGRNGKFSSGRSARSSTTNRGSGGNQYAIIGGEINDPNWNAPTTQILKDTFSVPFSQVLGVNTDWRQDVLPGFGKPTQNMRSVPNSFNPPAIMEINFMPTYGSNSLPTDPINTGANSFYAYVVHMNSRNKSYDAPDLMQLGIALDSAYMFYLELVRCYGFLNYYQWYNRAVPNTLIQSLGFNFLDLSSKMADFRAFINATAYRLQQIFFPDGFDYMTRHMWLVRDVYADSPQMKAQLYLFRPSGYYIWHEGPDATMHQGKAYNQYRDMNWLTNNLRLSGNERTLDDCIKLMNAIITPIIESQDFNLMSGDIMKAFPVGSQMKVMGITENYNLKPIYSQEILMEIENATIFDMPISTNPTSSAPNYTRFACDIYQDNSLSAAYLHTEVNVRTDWIDTSKVMSHPEPYQGYRTSTGEGINVKQVNNYTGIMPISAVTLMPSTRLLNMHKQVVEPTDTTVAINFKVGKIQVSSTGFQSNGYLASMTGIGTEILTGAIIRWTGLQFMPFSTVQVVDHTYLDITINSPDYVKNVFTLASSKFNYVSAISAFDWAPFYQTANYAYFEEPDQSRKPYSLLFISDPIGDYDNYTTITDTEVGYMHAMANLNKFTCKKMGAFTPS